MLTAPGDPGCGGHDGAHVATYVLAMTVQSDPARLATLGKRQANSRLKRILYYLVTARGAGADQAAVIDQAQAANGEAGTPRAPMVKASLLRNLKITDGFGMATPENMAKLRRCNASVVMCAGCTPARLPRWTTSRLWRKHRSLATNRQTWKCFRPRSTDQRATRSAKGRFRWRESSGGRTHLSEAGWRTLRQSSFRPEQASTRFQTDDKAVQRVGDRDFGPRRPNRVFLIFYWSSLNGSVRNVLRPNCKL